MSKLAVVAVVIAALCAAGLAYFIGQSHSTVIMTPPAATASTTPNPTTTPSQTPSANTTTVPVNVGRVTVSELGTVAHHAGDIVLSNGQTIIAFGDIHQDGGLWIKEFTTPGTLNMNGLPGDVNLVLFTGSQTTQLKQTVQEYISSLEARGYMVDP